MGISPGLAAYKLSFQLSPIVLQGGIAASIPGGMLPIISITQALDFTEGLLSGGNELTDLDDFFANFHPLPGTEMLAQELGKYPFANQAIAANAVIRQSLPVSYRMICPASGESGYAVKLATMLALRAVLSQHNAQGGTYICATPSFFFTSCVFKRLFDTSNTADKQAQNTWQWDFEQPLLTLSDAIGAQQSLNSLLGQINNGTSMTSPSWTGLSPTVGNPASLAGPPVVPALAGPAGGGTAAPSYSGPSPP
jgi:hypothetical protein